MRLREYRYQQPRVNLAFRLPIWNTASRMGKNRCDDECSYPPRMETT
jgi:hypothetical protein